MPQPGNAAYRAAYNPRLGERTFRFVHGKDPVPIVPPGKMGFRHVGGSLEELAEIGLSVVGINRAPAFSAQEKAAALAAAALSAPIRDHLTDGYLRASTPPPDGGAQSNDAWGIS
jgi:hypothetical protein